jgi:glycosyltransferase involved in cell wall biosynthesis
VMISDRLSTPLLPIRPYILVVHDYLQRYLPHSLDLAEYSFLAAARLAERVLVTTRFTEGDALQYAGVEREKVFHVPMLVPQFENVGDLPTSMEGRYFIWPTNAAIHKNHVNAFRALRIYWEELGGSLDCHITGVNTSALFDDDEGDLSKLAGNSAGGMAALRSRIRLRGELSDALYQRELAGARFLWHPARIDNGTFSVVDAARLRVPSLSSDYPPMHEIDSQFELGLAWTPSDDPVRMAGSLRWMEDHVEERRLLLPSKHAIESQNVDALAGRYWTVVRECL